MWEMESCGSQPDLNEPAPMNKILNTRWPNVAYHTVSTGFP